jgi:hypothetical protein
MGRRLFVDAEAARADAFRRRAIELAMQAKREDDPGQRRFLLDKARNLQRRGRARPAAARRAGNFLQQPKQKNGLGDPPPGPVCTGSAKSR